MRGKTNVAPERKIFVAYSFSIDGDPTGFGNCELPVLAGICSREGVNIASGEIKKLIVNAAPELAGRRIQVCITNWRFYD